VNGVPPAGAARGTRPQPLVNNHAKRSCFAGTRAAIERIDIARGRAGGIGSKRR
jgi:hypothetical protein